MAKRKQVEAHLSLAAKIDSQEVHVEFSGDGSERHPRNIGTYIELRGTLETPLKGTTSLAISIYETKGSLQDENRTAGMIFAVKPTVYMSLWVDRQAADRLVTLVSAKRITDFNAVSEPTRYGKALLYHWSLRTAPDQG